jgi:adenylyltransferase/sulfurtransferase
VLGVLPGVLGTIQATEAIKLVTGIGEPLLGRLLTYDALGMRFDEFKFSRRDDCAVCGTHPTITEPLDAPELCSVETLESIRRLTPTQLSSLLSDPTIALIDVRNPDEFEAGRLPNAINIPVAQLADRIHQLPPSRTPVFICRSGARSLTACAIASRAGASSVAHLEGGLLAWSAEVDASIVVI